MKTGLAVAVGIALLSVTADASPLFSASGNWVGVGRIAPKVDQSMERARCQIEVEPAPDESEVSISGRCALAGGSRRISMRYVRQPGGYLRAGFWSPTDEISVQYGGTETDDTVTLQTLELVDFEGEMYKSRVTMVFDTDAAFTFEQIVQKEGADRWVRIVDMRFQR